MHVNEQQLRRFYAAFAEGKIDVFLDGCTDDATFSVPGNAAVSGQFTKASFMKLLEPVMTSSAGTFEEHVLDVFANDEHGVLLLLHKFTRDGEPREYRTAHIVELRGGRIAKWTEHPGSIREFETAWGRRAG